MDVERDFRLVAVKCPHCPARYWFADKDIASESTQCDACGRSFMLRDAKVIYYAP